MPNLANGRVILKFFINLAKKVFLHCIVTLF